MCDFCDASCFCRVLDVLHSSEPWSLLSTPLRNLRSFNSLILGNVPLFQMDTILTAPEIIFHPNASEINKMCVHCVRSCVEITKVRAEMSVWVHRGLVTTDGWPTALGSKLPRPWRTPAPRAPCPDCCSPSWLLLWTTRAQSVPRLDPSSVSPLYAITTSPMLVMPPLWRRPPPPASARSSLLHTTLFASPASWVCPLPPQSWPVQGGVLDSHLAP